MYIIVQLNPGQGADVGPNFELTANVGVLSPSTATLDELLAGVSVSADDSATQVFVTSQGVCDNTLTLNVVAGTTTTTSTTTTTTTTSTTTSTTTTTNADCLLAGGTAKKAPYVYYPDKFVFGVLGGSGTNNICSGITTPVYGPPCDPADPLCVFSVPAFLFLDPCGNQPFTQYSLVRNIGFTPSAVYNYNTSTGAVGSYVTSCL